MFTLNKDICLPVKAYISRNRIDKITFNEKNSTYVTPDGVEHGGLLFALKKTYYPYYVHSVRGKNSKRVQVKSSSKKIGSRVDDEIASWTSRPSKMNESWHKYTKALILHLTKKGHRPIVAQLPVRVNHRFWGDRYTQADLITERKGKLYMWEVKTGAPPAGGVKKGFLERLDAPVANTIFNHWQLQRHYTYQGLLQAGLPVEKSYVIQVFQRKDDVVVKVRNADKWTEKYLL